MGTCHAIPLKAAGLHLWEPRCQSLSLSCCVVLCNSLLQAHAQTPAGQGEEWEECGGCGTHAKGVSNNKTKWPNYCATGEKKKKTFWLSFNVTEQCTQFTKQYIDEHIFGPILL